MASLYYYLFPSSNDTYQSKETRSAILTGIQKGDISISPCDILKLIKDPITTKKKSQSSTIIVLGELKFKINNPEIQKYISKNPEVVLKLSFKEVGPDNSLTTEIHIYRLVTNVLFMKNVTPNVILYLGAFECKNFYSYIQELANEYREPFLEEMLRQMDKIEYQDTTIIKGKKEHFMYDFNTVNVLLLERGKGTDLYEWITPEIALKERSVEELKQILFQIFYTLWVFSFVRLRHNDLHFGNIWIDTDEKTEKVFVYFVDENTYYVIKTKYIVKLYDFDLSAIEGWRNNKLDFLLCKNYGQCNDPNSKFDLYMVQWILYTYVDDFKKAGWTKQADFIKNFVKSNIDLSLFKEMGGRKLCKKVNRYCSGNWEPDDSLIKSPYDTVRNKYFDNFKKRLPSYDPKYLPSVYDDVYYAPDVDRNKINFTDIKPIRF